MATVDETYGLDSSTYPADLTFRRIGGGDMLAEQAARRITTPPGFLWWDPVGTIDIHAWVNDDFTPADLRAREQIVSALFSGDPRMEVSTTLRLVERSLYVDLEITPLPDGAPFTVSIEAATGALTISTGGA